MKTLILIKEELKKTTYGYKVKVTSDITLEEAMILVENGNYEETWVDSGGENKQSWQLKDEEKEMDEATRTMLAALRDFSPAKVDLSRINYVRDDEFLNPDICQKDSLNKEQYNIIQNYLSYLDTKCLTDHTNYYFLSQAISAD